METPTGYIPTAEERTLISRVLADVAAVGRLPAEDAADFAQSVYLHLLETDYDLLRRFEGRSSLRTYLMVAVRRMLIDYRNHMYGRWRPSATARRLGGDAVQLERLIYRDGHSRDQAVEIAVPHAPAPRRRQLLRLASELPPRVKRQRVPDAVLEQAPAPVDPDPLEEHERRRAERRVLASLGRALRELSREDRQLLYWRFKEGRTIRGVAASLRTEERRLYRRVERILKVLRARLMATSRDEAPRVAQAIGARSGAPGRIPIDSLRQLGL